MPSVLQSWVSDLTFMQQSVLLTAIRGPDGQAKYDPPKMLLRWYRRCVLISALDGIVLDNPSDPRGGSFTGPSVTGNPPYVSLLKLMDSHVVDYIRNMDAIPAHFQRHFMHAVEILGYKHPDANIRDFWKSVYFQVVMEMSLEPETEAQMDMRLGDNMAAWLDRSHIATKE